MATRGKQEKLKTAFCHLLKQLILGCLACIPSCQSEAIDCLVDVIYSPLGA